MEYRLDELFDLQMGKTPARKNPEYWNSNDYKWISIADLSKCEKYITETKEHISSIAVQESGISEIPANTVIMSFKLSIGKTAITKEPIYSNEAIMSFRDKGVTPLLPDYIYYMFSGRDWSKGSNTAVMGTTLNKATLSQIRIYVHAYEDQKRIVELLDKVSSIISKRKQELVELDDLIKARFVEMFGDPKLNDRGWNSGIISDYYEVKGGKRIPKGMGYADGITAHPYLRATDMKNETILDDDIHYIDDDVFERIKRYTVKGGDIYLTNVGVNLGMAGVIPEKYDGANLTENAVKLVPKTEKVIDGVFLAYYINSPGIQDYINERKMSVGVPKLAIFRIETMPLLLPPIELQMKFIEFVNQIDKSKLLSGCRLFHSWAPEIEKSESCWRAPTEDKGFAGMSTPTMTPADRKNLNHVGVPRRRTKDLRGCRRQQ